MIGLTNIFDTIGEPVDWILVHLESAFAALAPTRSVGAFGLAIIVTTLLIRTALFPIYGWQLRAMARTQAEQRIVAPQLKQLRQKYRKEPQKLSQEMQKLYKEHGISPFSSCLGCLPALVQLPVLFALYNGIRLATNHLSSDRGFLWVGDVSRTLKEACCEHSGAGGLVTHPHLLIIPALAMGATYLQARMMTPPVHGDMSDAERKQADISKIFVYVGPAMVGLFSYTFYQGITLYWLTQSAFMIAQQYYVRGWGSVRVPSWLPGGDRTTPMSFPRGAPIASPARAAVVESSNGRPRRKTAGPTGVDAPKQGKTVPGPRPRPAARPGRPNQRPNSRRRKRR
ncbi:MAG: membrane protein insertase YidC [Candidatus Dormibacteria bacterium]